MATFPGRTSCHLKFIAFALLLLGLAPASHAVVLYDVDFSAPTHVLDAPPTVGTGAIPRNTPSRLNITPGSSGRVVSGVGALTNRPLELRAVGQGGRLGGGNVFFSLDDAEIPAGLSLFTFGADVIIDQIDNNQVALLWDAPDVHGISFRSTGDIAMFMAGSTDIIGSWVSGTLVHVESSFNIVSGEWTVALNGGPVFSDIARNTDLRDLRFGSTTTLTSLSYLDNLRISGFPVSEPGTWALFVGGLSLVLMGAVLRGPRYRRR